MTPDEERGQQLRRWRRERKIKQWQLADYLAIARPTISKWEHGAKMPWSMVLAIRHWDCEHPRASIQ